MALLPEPCYNVTDEVLFIIQGLSFLNFARDYCLRPRYLILFPRTLYSILLILGVLHQFY